ncbi:hypothetical protein [Sphingobium indicum]|uniref:Uncharacterized protein n=1 Tax=Sphingobium indicum (strain DSM 16412 / CCM 7286 / MTCC 6364 / B90A) TaxID=861109 RepID=A0A1L5BMH7_SPHIB|nr:hypothetical protein [Sphingobium indicum]APL94111.1 hypothetical protein SIDU_06095 [Sphingobium indicum B90A]
MSFLSNIFLSPSKRRLLKAISWGDDAFAEYIAWGDVRQRLNEGLRRQSDRSIQIGPRDIDAANSVLFAAFKICSARCASGEHHIYRGILSGVGKGYLNLAQEILNNLVDNGFLSDEDAEEEMECLQLSIKEEG